ncbi:alpha/beta fold hydrolase [Agarilytica rhodophyticola]|uniref:alpha/beta fold hydrolase n=1 Tax=Agarilytica rhodophyticola TaxID=1737490 RepID=UPI000B34285A|nr:alpha/beta hydrolase [Agarilytica rhodophyticola]
MKIIKYNNAKTLFFISGMFAGGWMWKDSHKSIAGTQHLLLEEPLCAIGGTVSVISEHIIKELKKVDEKVILVGNSLGSFICMNIAKLIPEKVEKVIISGSAGFGEVILDIKINSKNSSEIAQRFVDLICYDKSKASIEVKEKTAKSFKENLRNIIGLMRESNAANATELLTKVKCPVHAIWGENDVITPISQAITTFDNFGIPVSLINECGHSPMYEKPTEFASCVSECIK